MPSSPPFPARRYSSHLSVAVLEDRCGPSTLGLLMTSSLPIFDSIATEPSLISMADDVVSQSPARASWLSASDSLSSAPVAATDLAQDVVPVMPSLATGAWGDQVAREDCLRQILGSPFPMLTTGLVGIEDSVVPVTPVMATRVPPEARGIVRVAGNFHPLVSVAIGADASLSHARGPGTNSSATTTVQATAFFVDEPGNLASKVWSSSTNMFERREMFGGDLHREGHSGHGPETFGGKGTTLEAHNLTNEATALGTREDKNKTERRDSQPDEDVRSDERITYGKAAPLASLDDRKNVESERRDFEQALDDVIVALTKSGPTPDLTAIRLIVDRDPQSRDGSFLDSQTEGGAWASDVYRVSLSPMSSNSADPDESTPYSSEPDTASTSIRQAIAAADKAVTGANLVVLGKQTADLLWQFQPLDVSALDKALAEYVDQLSVLGRDTADAVGELGPSVWLLASAMCVVGIEVVRQRRRRMILELADGDFGECGGC